jgi:dTMP kinase
MSTHDFSALAGIPKAGIHPRLFCLEAGDKVGKSTLADNLVPWLGSRGHEARVFREPGGSPRAEELRRILKDPHNGLSPAEAADMFFEAREDLLRTTLLPWLAADRGRIAILDRYFWSTIVYQGVIGGQDMSKLAGMITRVCKGAIPVRTFMLDLDPAVAHARAAADGGAKAADVDAGDLMSPADKARLRAGYSALVDEFPGLIIRVDAARTKAGLTEEVGSMILAIIR